MLGVALLCEKLKNAGWKDRLMSESTGRVTREKVEAEVQQLEPESLKLLLKDIFARA